MSTDNSTRTRRLIGGIARDRAAVGNHVETIVLAGAELALAFNEATAGFPAIDCTRLRVAGIMRRILEP